MADSYSALLRLRLQATGGNTNTWGSLLNTAAVQLIEDAVAGVADITVAGSNITLTTANGANDQARKAVLNLTGAPGASRDIVVPTLSKVYVVRNQTDATMVIKSAESGADTVSVEEGVTTLVICDEDGNIIEIAPQSAAIALNSLALGGVPAAQYARLNNRQTFTKPQMYAISELTMAASVTPDFADANFFTGELNDDTTIELPDSLDSSDAQPFEMVFSQAAAGGPFSITFDSFYDFLGQTPSMPSAADAVLYVRGVVIPGLARAICVAQIESGSTVQDLSLSVNEENVDVFRRLGSPAGIVNVTITVESGVVISSRSSGAPAMDFSGGFASGSTINLINLGYIIGRGGDGGNGGHCHDRGDDANDEGFSPTVGRDGGNAIRAPGAGITFNITNANGRIWGGGGGGGGGTAGCTGGLDWGNGGGGGGGAGLGRGGIGWGGYSNDSASSVNPASDGSDGALNLDGTAAGGAGGAGAASASASGKTGGAGGDYGAAGSASDAHGETIGVSTAAGGSAGKAVQLTGASPNFVNGSGSPNVKGAVS